MMQPIHTIGHSTHAMPHFVGLLRGAGVDVIADVRSSPYSRHVPHFSRDALRDALADGGIRYLFLGDQLGARPRDRTAYADGVARYDLIAGLPSFRVGISRLLEGARTFRIALLCAERDPLDCHRAVLVARHLAEAGADVAHILADGAIEQHAGLEQRMIALTGADQADLFAPPAGVLAEAYARRGAQIAYAEQGAAA
jgi:uncharacterized protein (DUF488 family)